jgi:hypothetical protein
LKVEKLVNRIAPLTGEEYIKIYMIVYQMMRITKINWKSKALHTDEVTSKIL